MGNVLGVMQHHTGPGSEKGLLELIRDGRPDLAGPLSQLFLPKSGVFHVIAAGRTNHAGNGSWHGITSGNAQAIGIEAQNAGDGKDPRSEEHTSELQSLMRISYDDICL